MMKNLWEKLKAWKIALINFLIKFLINPLINLFKFLWKYLIKLPWEKFKDWLQLEENTFGSILISAVIFSILAISFLWLPSLVDEKIYAVIAFLAISCILLFITKQFNKPFLVKTITAFLIFFLIFVVFFLIYLGGLYYSYECITEESNCDIPSKIEFWVEFFVKIATGILALLAILVVDKRAKAMEAGNKLAEKEYNQKILSEARGLLQKNDEASRIIGADNLFNLASEDITYRNQVTKILCLHIKGKTKDKEYKSKYPKNPSIEIQNILDLLTKKKIEIGKEKFLGEYGLNFSNTHLAGANLSRVNLFAANLSESNLQNANFSSAYLQGSNLKNADLQGANFQNAQLQRSNFRDARLQGTSFNNANLQKSILEDACLQGSDLQKTCLQGVNLRGAQLQGTYLNDAQLQGTVLGNTQLQGANLNKTQLQGSYIDNIGLFNLYTFEIHINHCAEKPADLSEIVFSGGLDNKWLEEAINYLHEASWPEKRIEKFREKMEIHINRPAKYGISDEVIKENSINVNSYSKGKAEQWIKEYRKFMKKTEW